MLCQNCHQNPATIHLTTNINGRQTSLDLCQNCYRALKNQVSESGNGMGDPFGFDFNNFFEKDAALARRLQPVQVNEPSIKEALEILKGIQSKYESYHHVKYTPQALKAAVTLSSRYIQDRYLPDKAIDLLDEAGSRKNLTLESVDPKLLEERIKNAEEQKQAALKEEDYEKAAYYRDQVSRFEKMQQESVDDSNVPTVTEKDMEKIVEEKTNIPVGELKAKEKEQLKNLAQSLESHVIGQDEAVDKVARAIRRNRIGFNKSGRPIGSFLFICWTNRCRENRNC